MFSAVIKPTHASGRALPYFSRPLASWRVETGVSRVHGQCVDLGSPVKSSNFWPMPFANCVFLDPRNVDLLFSFSISISNKHPQIYLQRERCVLNARDAKLTRQKSSAAMKTMFFSHRASHLLRFSAVYVPITKIITRTMQHHRNLALLCMCV